MVMFEGYKVFLELLLFQPRLTMSAELMKTSVVHVAIISVPKALMSFKF